jgi:DNA-directed RNA polymerase sigma subunit (sigma70/sigma32)
MNLKDCKGKVPVFVGGDIHYKFVDFPTREQFDELFKRNNKTLRDKYWGVLKMRSNGHTLIETGEVYTLTRERIRQIEAKFVKKVAVSLETGML